MSRRDRPRRETRLLRYGKPPSPGPANPPVVRASTILHDTRKSYDETTAKRDTDDSVLSYGRRGTTTAHALMAALTDIENGDGCWLFPTGVAAIAAVLRTFVKPGDHLLIVDSAFHAAKTVCDEFLTPSGVEVDSFPWDATDLTPWIKPSTRAVFVESPGSDTFAVMDLPKLSASAHAHGATVIADNTYGSGWLYRPLDLGCDVSVIAGTKYLSGHADVMMGAAIAKGSATAPLRRAVLASGQTLAPDEAYATLRGMRTLHLRLERHQQNAERVLAWFSKQDVVERLFHPSLKEHAGHDLWQRDASGTNGLVSVVFKPNFDQERFLAGLELFAFGSSWGGFESLVKTFAWRQREAVRFHIGLEHIDDLLEDLTQAMAAVR